MAPAIAVLGGSQVDATFTTVESASFPRPAGGSVLIDRACGLLGVSKRTVYYWIRAGRLRTIRTRGGSQRILLASIQDLTTAGAGPVSRRRPRSLTSDRSVAVCP